MQHRVNRRGAFPLIIFCNFLDIKLTLSFRILIPNLGIESCFHSSDQVWIVCSCFLVDSALRFDKDWLLLLSSEDMISTAFRSSHHFRRCTAGFARILFQKVRGTSATGSFTVCLVTCGNVIFVLQNRHVHLGTFKLHSFI